MSAILDKSQMSEEDIKLRFIHYTGTHGKVVCGSDHNGDQDYRRKNQYPREYCCA